MSHRVGKIQQAFCNTEHSFSEIVVDGGKSGPRKVPQNESSVLSIAGHDVSRVVVVIYLQYMVYNSFS